MTPVDLCHFREEKEKKLGMATKKSSLAVDLIENEKNSVRQNLLGDSALNGVKEKTDDDDDDADVVDEGEEKKEYEIYRASCASTYVTNNLLLSRE